MTNETLEQQYRRLNDMLAQGVPYQTALQGGEWRGVQYYPVKQWVVQMWEGSTGNRLWRGTGS